MTRDLGAEVRPIKPVPSSDPKPHPAADIFPLLDEEGLAALVEDIKTYGQKQPIVIHENQILDGRNRWAACKIAGVQPRTIQWDGKGSPTSFVVSQNLHRLHLNPTQRATIAVQLLPIFAAEAKEREIEAGREGGKLGGRGNKKGRVEVTLPFSPTLPSSRPVSQVGARAQDESKRAMVQAAKATGAGASGTKVLASAFTKAPELMPLARDGKATIADVKRMAELPKEERAAIVKAIQSGECKNAAAAVKPAKRPWIFEDALLQLVDIVKRFAAKTPTAKRAELAYYLRDLAKDVEVQ